MRNVVRAACIATAVLAALAGQALTAGPAAAITGLQRVGANSVLNSSNKSFDVDCPGGTVITGGGGYLVATSPSPKGKVSFSELRPKADNSGFDVTANEVDVNFVPNWQAVAVGLCAPEPAGYDVVEDVSDGGSGSSQTADVDCPGSTVVIGTGAYITGGTGHVFLESMVPSDDLGTVTTTAHETTTGTLNNWTVTAVAICANAPAGGFLKVSSTTPASDPYDSTLSLCPDGKQMYGTGFSINSGGGQVLLHGLNVTPATTVRLAASEDADGYGSNWSLTTYATCAS